MAVRRRTWPPSKTRPFQNGTHIDLIMRLHQNPSPRPTGGAAIGIFRQPLAPQPWCRLPSSRIVKASSVLVVDDFAPWRRFVCSMLQEQPELRIVGQLSDGLEAVQKAQELRPDLILMDVGLPGLNGIEAARRIRKVSNNSKIVLVSANRDLDFIEEAFFSGVSGYVLKYAAQTQLLPAIKAVMQDERFLCPCLRQDPLSLTEVSI